MVRRIEKAAVIGSGIMGGGIAALLAGAGVETLLMDIVPFDLTDEEKNDPEARNRIVKGGMDGALKAKPPLFYTKKDAARISTGNLTDDFDKLGECDLIIEVVVEDLKIKQDLFARIEKVRKPTAIIATNTSGLPLSKISEKFSKDMKEHFLGTHFFNPVRYMKLLELIPGAETSQEVLDFVADFGEKRLGKGIVWAKDTPNFIGNRIGVQLICQAFKLVDEMNIPINEVDQMFGPSFGMPNTAVFALADLVGLDTIGHLADNSYELLTEDEQRDVYQLPGFVKEMLDKKMFGNKTKIGFYQSEKTPEGKRIKKVINPSDLSHAEYDKKAKPGNAAKVDKAAPLADKQKTILFSGEQGSDFAWKLIASALSYAGHRIPEIADNIVEIDNAMKWGYAWESGPFEIWDNVGVKDSLAKIEEAGFKVPESVKKMVDGGNETFYKLENGKKYYFDLVAQKYVEINYNPSMIFLANLRADNKVVKSNDSVSLIDLGDGVFDVEFHTKMNALNGDIIGFLQTALDYTQDNGVGLVVGNQAGGMPGAFSAGADLGFMLEMAKKKDWTGIDNFIKTAHSGLMALRYANFPVIAAPFGMTLGGGCEVCLASDKIVAHADLYIGLVEVGAGLLPGGGGNLNLWRKFINSVPGPVTVSNVADYFIPVFQSIAMATVTASAADAQRKGFLNGSDRIVMNKDYLIGEAKKEVLRMVEDGYAAPMKEDIMVMGEAAWGMINAEMLNMKSANYILEYDEVVAKKIAWVLAGGEVKQGTKISEEAFLANEREAFVDLWKNEKTQARAEHIYTTGKPLRN